MSLPSKTIVPLRGRSRPKIVLISVDLPAPLGPITVTTSPSRTSSETPLRMSTSGTYPATRSSARSTTPLRESEAIRASFGRSRLPDRSRAEVGVDHAPVCAHLLRRPVGDHPSLRHHDHAVGVVHHHLHVVLDEQERDALLRAQALHVVEQAAP